jgi:hypothetical protein
VKSKTELFGASAVLMELLYELRLTDEWIWSSVGVAVDRINSKYLKKRVAHLKEFPLQNK